MTARAWGMVSSTSRFHLRVRWGGTSTRMRLKPAMCAALAASRIGRRRVTPITGALFRRPSPEPDVRLSPHPALQWFMSAIAV